MEKKNRILQFDQFLNEQEIPGATAAAPGEIKTPETEQEAKSRIALGIVKDIFGDVGGLTGGIDTLIDQTREVKESLPYKGCGVNEPFKIDRTPLSVKTIKILLEYLQEKGKGDYTKSLEDLNEKRAIILGVRNKISVKRETINQDRFCDSLYYIPGNSNEGTSTDSPKGSTGPSQQKEKPKAKKDESVFDRLKKNKKNESLISIIDESIDQLNIITESDLLSFTDFESIIKEKEFLIKGRDLLESNRISEDEFFEMYEQQKKNTQETAPQSLGDMISPYQITTVPSLAYYGKKPMNPKGVGIKLPGDTAYLLQESTLGGKLKYKMMVEAQPIKVARYPIGVTKYETYKPADVYTENCGMQIHRSSTKGVGVCIGPWSAGCQVFADNNEWEEFISKAEKETMNGGKFTYALIQLDDIPQDVFNSALKGISASEPAVVKKPQPNNKDVAKADKPGGLKKFGRITED